MNESRQQFQTMVVDAPNVLHGDLDVGALLIAQAVDDEVSIGHELARIDALAKSVADVTTAEELADRLFGSASDATMFRGNRDAYYEAENSLLPRVLDRRLGIPISLSVVMIEVGRRLDIGLHGVGMPGHFLVGIGAAPGSPRWFIDPFHDGQKLDVAGCEQILKNLAGPLATLPPGALDPTPHALILKRMLANLAAIGTNTEDPRLTLAARSMLSAFGDATAQDHVQHAYAAAEIRQYGEAAAAAARALPLVPVAAREQIESQCIAWQAQLN